MDVTVNGLIASTNGLLGLAMIFLGCALFWQARHRLRAWPVSALLALGGAFLMPGVVWAHIALLRTASLPGVVGPNGVGTLVLRIATLAVMLALVQRVVRGRLLADADRARLDGTG